MIPTSYDEAIEQLYGLRRVGMKLDLLPVIQGMQLLGDPQDRYPSIHVAGTNGKGSTCAYIDAIIRAHGVKTGLFTSPHLVSFSERMQVDREPISKEAILALLARVGEAVPSFSFFETATAMALLHFAQEGIGCGVIETGLGGRLDATSVVNATVTAITSIGEDHALALSGDLRRVAWEKAGIMRPGVPMVLPALPLPIHEVLVQSADAIGAPLLVQGAHYTVQHQRGMVTWQFGDDPQLTLPLPIPGEVQVSNLGVALTACRLWLGRPLQSTHTAQALTTLKWDGRFATIGRFTLDGSHNLPAAHALARTLQAHSPPWDLLAVGMNADKDVRAFLAPLLPLFKEVQPLPVNSERGLPPAALEGLLRAMGAVVRSAPQQLDRSFLDGLPGDRILVTGSFYLAGEVQKLLCGAPGDALPLTDPAR